jgi:hypothetical protein
MENTLEGMTKWMRDSSLAANKAKTEVCLFYKPESRIVHLTLGGTRIETKNVLSVLGLQFDSRLQCSQQVANTTKKLKEL